MNARNGSAKKGEFLRSGTLLVLAAAIVAGHGCAYYNTFYNAERAFEKGEKARLNQETFQQSGRRAGGQTAPAASAPSRTATAGGDQSYRTAIEKSAKVLVNHPNSRYVDDALLLMAKSYYRLSEFAPALRKCTELITSLPNSPLVTEARYWEGMSLWQLGRIEEASIALGRIAGDDRSRFQGDAAFGLARLKREHGSLTDAIELYRVAVRRATERSFQYAAREELALALVQDGQFAQAVDVYRDLIRFPQPTLSRYENYLKIAATQRAKGDHTAALATLLPLLRDQRYTDQVPRTRLEIARTREEAGEAEAAVLLYQQVLEDAERLRPAVADPVAPRPGAQTNEPERTAVRTAETAETHFRLAGLQERRFRNFENAAAHYAFAAQSLDQEIALPAKRRLDDITLWARLHSTLADSSDSTSASAKEQAKYALAEHLFFSLDEPDSAAAYFRDLEGSAGNRDLRLRARFSLGWILRDVKRDTSRSDSLWDQVLADTGATRSARELRTAIRSARGLAPREPGFDVYKTAEDRWFDSLQRLSASPPDSAVADSTLAAEWWRQWRVKQRIEGDSTARMLEEIVEQHPVGGLATRSRFMLAWYAENVLDDTSAANRWYRAARQDSVFAPETGRLADLVLQLRAAESAGQRPDSTQTRGPAPTVQPARNPEEVGEAHPAVEPETTPAAEASPAVRPEGVDRPPIRGRERRRNAE